MSGYTVVWNGTKDCASGTKYLGVEEPPPPPPMDALPPLPPMPDEPEERGATICDLVLEIVQARGPMTANEVCQAMPAVRKGTIYQTCWTMEKDGRLRVVRLVPMGRPEVARRFLRVLDVAR